MVAARIAAIEVSYGTKPANSLSTFFNELKIFHAILNLRMPNNLPMNCIWKVLYYLVILLN